MCAVTLCLPWEEGGGREDTNKRTYVKITQLGSTDSELDREFRDALPARVQ